MASKPAMPWRDPAQRKVDRSYGPAGGDGIGDFAAGFIMRPFGAAVFGWFGDRNGRARTMQISVALIGITGVRIRRNLH
jgi:MFS family permease